MTLTQYITLFIGNYRYLYTIAKALAEKCRLIEGEKMRTVRNMAGGRFGRLTGSSEQDLAKTKRLPGFVSASVERQQSLKAVTCDCIELGAAVVCGAVHLTLGSCE